LIGAAILAVPAAGRAGACSPRCARVRASGRPPGRRDADVAQPRSALYRGCPLRRANLGQMYQHLWVIRRIVTVSVGVFLFALAAVGCSEGEEPPANAGFNEPPAVRESDLSQAEEEREEAERQGQEAEESREEQEYEREEVEREQEEAEWRAEEEQQDAEAAEAEREDAEAELEEAETERAEAESEYEYGYP